MNSKINGLKATLAESHGNCESIQKKIQAEYNKVFDDSKTLAKAISNAESASMYQQGYDGEIESWFRFDGLREFQECRDEFEAWLSDNYCMRVDWDNDCLLVSQGDDNLIIQDDSYRSRDNGVWQSGKRVIAESEYRNEGDDVDEEKRNALIEAHMEKTGYYPGVFRVTQHGDVFEVSTLKKVAS